VSRRNSPGLFNGWWTDLDGRKLRRIRRDEYPMLYRLHREHADIRLGVTLLGMKGPWHR
jgi:hypothetical protein